MRRIQSVIIAAIVALLLSGSLRAADVKSGVLLSGTEFETTYYVIESGRPGPLVMITGGVHGNEPAGYRAADVIRRWPIVTGRMIVVPACNPPGLKADTRNMPGRGAGDAGNLNRLFPKTGKANEATGEPAKTLWAFLQQQKPDWFIDLHEGVDFNLSTTTSVGSSVIFFGEDPKALRAARMMAQAVNMNIAERGHQINLLSRGPIEGSMARAAAQRLHIPGMICETTTKGQSLALRVGEHCRMIYALLSDLGLITVPLDQLPAFDPDAKDVIIPKRKKAAMLTPTNPFYDALKPDAMKPEGAVLCCR